MSLTVYLVLKDPESGKGTYVYDSNITHNLGVIAREVGVYEALWRPEEKGWKKAKEIIATLEYGLERLRENPIVYRLLNPKNGWGTYEDLVRFVELYLEACKKFPSAEIEVSR